MAGIWDIWKSPEGGLLHSFSILTTEANELTAGIHQRMPLILPKEMETRWLYSTDHKQLLPLLKPFPAELMSYYPVSSKVNSVANDGEELIQKMPEQMDLFGG
jgi:putative SOS response-associated peptidase YedK